ncbi:glycine/betaine ABC transporter [Actinobaculum sp. 352]|nr:glycine/betaine ABC transporter [Actinobaculum sp. 313]RTE49496.1 glycine/betaine ABC transporter [Actinobaculum sp. 352]
MTGDHMKRRIKVIASLAVAGLALVGCSSSDPTGRDSQSAAPSGTIVIGSQASYSNEIIAEIYAQHLEAHGYTVDRQYQIGSREVYIPELEAGRVDVIPEYTGNLLQYYDSSTTATTPEQIRTALDEALPEGLRILDLADASDQDTYTVTRETADEYGLTAIGDLSKLEQPVALGANAEFEGRPYGPTGAKEVYGVDIAVTPINDYGGSLTLDALRNGDVQVADIYSADPAIPANDLVILEDPEGLILTQNVVPLVTTKVDDDAAVLLNEISARLDQETLVALNTRSVNEQATSASIAKDWLAQAGLD